MIWNINIFENLSFQPEQGSISSLLSPQSSLPLQIVEPATHRLFSHVYWFSSHFIGPSVILKLPHNAHIKVQNLLNIISHNIWRVNHLMYFRLDYADVHPQPGTFHHYILVGRDTGAYLYLFDKIRHFHIPILYFDMDRNYLLKKIMLFVARVSIIGDP